MEIERLLVISASYLSIDSYYFTSPVPFTQEFTYSFAGTDYDLIMHLHWLARKHGEGENYK